MALLGGAVLVSVGGLFQFLAFASGRDAKSLRSAKRVGRVQDLFAPELLAALPLFVAVRGRVTADSPLASTTSPDDRGAIIESVTEQHFLKQTEAGEWVRDAVTMSHIIRETPWSLTDPGAWVPASTRLWVIGASNAEGLQLATVFDMFDASPKGMLSASIDYLRGVKILGIRRTERALLMDTPVTAVGKVAIGEGGRLEIRAPGGRLPFYLSSKTVDELVESLGTASRTFVAISAVLTGLGVAIIARRAWEAFFTRRRIAAAAEARKQALLGVSARGEQGGGDAEGTGPAGVVPSTELCVVRAVEAPAVCLARPYDVVFKECGHMATCTACARGLTKCPMCRRPGGYIRVYRP